MPDDRDHDARDRPARPAAPARAAPGRRVLVLAGVLVRIQGGPMSTPKPQLDESQRSRVKGARTAWRYAIADARDVIDAEGDPVHAYSEAAVRLYFYLNEMLALVDELTGGAR